MEKIVGNLYDTLFDSSSFIQDIRKMQQVLPTTCKINEEVYQWTVDNIPTFSEQISLYKVKGVQGIEIFEDIKNGGISIRVLLKIGITKEFERQYLRLLEGLKTRYVYIYTVPEENENWVYLYIEKITSDLMSTYLTVLDFVDKIEDELKLDKGRMDLIEDLLRFRNGVSYINTSVFMLKDKNNQLKKVFSDFRLKKKYFFANSFDEETINITNFVNRYIDKYIPSYYKPVPKKENLSVVKLCTLGFEEAIQALKNICSICINKYILREELLDFELEDGYNPFRIYGTVDFVKNFEDLFETFLKLRKEVL